MQHRSASPDAASLDAASTEPEPTPEAAPPPADDAPGAAPEPLDATASRRTFLRGSLLGAGALGALGAIAAPELARAQTGALKTTVNHYHLPANDKTVHWGFFSKSLA